jgi:hypothetical protein
MTSRFEITNKETGETYPVTNIKTFHEETAEVFFGDDSEIFEINKGVLHNDFFAIHEVMV